MDHDQHTDANGHDEHEGHDHKNHHEMMIEDFKKRFYISMIVTIPILALSPMIQMWFNFEIIFPGSNLIILALSTFIFFYGVWPFLKGLVDELKAKTLGMMTLIAMAITVAYLYSSSTVFGLEGNDFFW